MHCKVLNAPGLHCILSCYTHSLFIATFYISVLKIKLDWTWSNILVKHLHFLCVCKIQAKTGRFKQYVVSSFVCSVHRWAPTKVIYVSTFFMLEQILTRFYLKLWWILCTRMSFKKLHIFEHILFIVNILSNWVCLSMCKYIRKCVHKYIYKQQIQSCWNVKDVGAVPHMRKDQPPTASHQLFQRSGENGVIARMKIINMLFLVWKKVIFCSETWVAQKKYKNSIKNPNIF